MSDQLRDQLQAFFDREAPEVTIEEVASRLRSRSTRVRRPWLVAVTAMGAVLLLVGGIPVLFGGRAADPSHPGGAPSSTTAGEPSPLRAEAELAVAARLAEDAPRSVTDEQIACVASATVEALDEERLSAIVAALDGPSAAVLPAGVVSDLERDRIVDAAAGCLPWTQSILDSLQDLPDISPEVVECAQAAAPSVETDRLAADIMLFGGEFMTVLNLVLPPDCLPQTGGSQADTPAGRLTAAQLMLAGVSPESAACVAEQVDALGGMPSGESDTDSATAAEQATAMMLGCLTPEEMALLSGSQADTPAGRLTAAQLMLAGVSPESAACVAEQVDALGGMPSGESDTDSATAAEQATAMMLGCLTPEEMALLSGPQADTPAGRLTAAQLMLAGVSPESAACVAEQVDALGGMPSGESDTDSATAAEQATAMMLGCLTPEEMALLSGPGSS